MPTWNKHLSASMDTVSYSAVETACQMRAVLAEIINRGVMMWMLSN